MRPSSASHTRLREQLRRVGRLGLEPAWRPPAGLASPPGRRPRLPVADPWTSEQGADAHPAFERRSEELARLEAALFLAREPLSIRRLAKLAGLSDGTRARALVRELNRLFEASDTAFRVEQIAGGFQLLTRAAFGPWVRRLLGTPAETRLSSAALETLAIVAYRQPVTRAEIESIRGVGCEEMLRQLMDRDFIAIGGRTEEIGRPNVYVTSRRFLQAFGLAKVDDLPPIEPPPESPSDAGGPKSDA
jgi:segregation and condensation protein B